MKNLLENDLPAFYGVGRRCICDENITSLSEFDLTEDDTQFVVDYKKGYASFCGNPFNLSVVNYDTYIGKSFIFKQNFNYARLRIGVDHHSHLGVC